MFKWLQLNHPDVAYAGVPNPMPWPQAADAPADDAPFPYPTLQRGIDLLLAELPATETGSWPQMKTILSELPLIEQALQSGDLSEAEGLLRRHLTLVPGLPMQCFNLAFVLGQRGDHESARQLLQTAGAGAPQCHWIWVQIGTVCETLNRREEAIAAYQKALTLDPKDLATKRGLHRLKALCLLIFRRPDGHDEEAFVTRDKMIEHIRFNIQQAVKDGVRDPLLQFARQFIAERDGELALESVQALLALDPADETARVLLGDALRVAGQLAEANAHLKALRKELPKSAAIAYALAWVAFERKQRSAGWKLIEETLALDPNHEQALSCKFKLGSEQKDEAVERQLAAWSVARASWQGLLCASLVARQRGDERSALLHAEQAYKLNPIHSMVLIQYTSLLKDCDNNELAAAVIQPVLRQGETDALVKMQFAGALHRLGLKDEALKHVNEVLSGDLRRLDVGLLEQYRVTKALWSGDMAEAEAELELHGVIALRRPIYLIAEREQLVHLLDGGLSIPGRKHINLAFKTPKAVHSVGFQQGKPDDKLPPVPLGYFVLRDMDPDTLLQTGVQFGLIINAQGKVQAWAKQEKRILRIEWSAYPAPTLPDIES